MLATSHFHISSPSPYADHPTISSPLAPRSANIHGRQSRNVYMSSPFPADAPALISSENTTLTHPKSFPEVQTQNQDINIFTFASNNININNPTSATSSKPIPFSQRSVKKAPTQQAYHHLQTARRSAFLRKVRDTRDEKRYEARGEDMMRLDFIQRQREIQAESERSGPSVPQDFGLEEEEEEEGQGEAASGLPAWSQQGSQMVLCSQRKTQEEQDDEDLRDEEALWESLQEDRESLWSDDTDYDALFEEALGNANGLQQGGDEMDMS